MSIFQRPNYTSEVTQFIESLKQAKPTLEAEQRHGRALLWDKPIDSKVQDEFSKSKVAQKPYVFQTQS